MSKDRGERPQLKVITATISLAALVMGAHAIAHIMGDLGWNVVLVGLCTALLSSVMAWIAVTRSTTRKMAVGACLGMTVVAAVANSPLSFIVVQLFDSSRFDPVDLLGGSIAAAIIGAFITVPLGLVFAVPFMLLIGLTYPLSRDRSHEALERTLLACGFWLAGVGLCCIPSGLALLDDRYLRGVAAETLTFSALACVMVGGCVALAAHLRLLSRRRWVERVVLGEVPDLSVVGVDELTLEYAHLRPLLSKKTPPESVVVRRRRGVEAGAYRTGERLEPVALL